MALAAAGNFALRQFGMGWITAPNRIGNIVFLGASIAISKPLYFFVEEASKGMFPEKPSDDENSSPLSKMGIKPIKTMDDLTEKVFWIAVSLALFIPITILAKEVVIYLGYQHLSIVTMPLVTLFKEELIDKLIFEALSLVLCLSLDSSPVMD